MRIGYTKGGLVFMVGEAKDPGDGHLTQVFLQWRWQDALNIASAIEKAAKEARKASSIIIKPERRAQP